MNKVKRSDKTNFFVYAPDNWTNKLINLLELEAKQQTYHSALDFNSNRPGDEAIEYEIEIHVRKTYVPKENKKPF